MDTRELSNKKNQLAAEFKTLFDQIAAENREPTPEEDARFDMLNKQIEANANMLRRAEQLREAQRNEPTTPAGEKSGPVVESIHNREQDRPWRTDVEFFDAVRVASRGVMDPRLFAGSPTGLGQSVPSEGGFLVPPQMSTEIWNGMSASPNNLLGLTDSYTVTGDSLTFNANAETSRVQGSLYGGVRAYWISEADQFTGSKPKFRQLKLEPQELCALTYCTDKLLQNSGPALGQYITRAASDAIMHLINQAIIEGSGAGQPLGLMGSPCLVTVSKETSQAAATINQINVSKMWARLHPLARQTAVWLHNVDIEPQLDGLSTVVRNVADSENVGGYANKVFDPERRTLKGRPLIPAEFCATLGTTGDIILVDLQKYATGVRGALDTAMSMHVRFEYAETAFRFKFAVDGQCWLGSAITPAKGSNTLTTVVALQTR